MSLHNGTKVFRLFFPGETSPDYDSLKILFKRTIYFTKGSPGDPVRMKEIRVWSKKCLRLFYDYFLFIIAVGFLAYSISLKSFIVLDVELLPLFFFFLLCSSSGLMKICVSCREATVNNFTIRGSEFKL